MNEGTLLPTKTRGLSLVTTNRVLEKTGSLDLRQFYKQNIPILNLNTILLHSIYSLLCTEHILVFLFPVSGVTYMQKQFSITSYGKII
jgi:hypothetical protein